MRALVPTRRTFSTGVPWTAKPGDWIVTLGTELVDICAEEEFRLKYDEIVEGTLVPQGVCRQIEDLTGIGSTQTPEKLYQAVDRLARIAVGDVKIDFTPGQLEELKHRAGKRGLTVKQEIQRVIDRIKDELFYRS